MRNEAKGIGLFSCVMIIAGGMVGSAIFSLSGLTIYMAGPAALISWVIGGLLMLFYGLVCTELALYYPKSGGVFVFPAMALGKDGRRGIFWGWVSTWGYIYSNIVAVSFSAMYVGIYLSAGFDIGRDIQIPAALAAVLICTLVNIFRFSLTSRIDAVMVIFLVLALSVYVISCFAGGGWDPDSLKPFFSQGALGKSGFLAATPTAMIGYSAVVAMAFMVSEVRNPERNIVRGVFIAMALVMVLYLSVIAATVGLVSASYLEENPGMRFIPLYAACFTRLSAYLWMARIISLAAVLALLTTTIAVMALNGRTIRAAAEKGLFPGVFAGESSSGSPVLPICLSSALSAVIACFPGLVSYIVSFGVLLTTVTVFINIISLIAARKKEKGQGRHCFLPGGNRVPIALILVLMGCYVPEIISGGWKVWVFTAVWYAVGIVIYLAKKRN